MVEHDPCELCFSYFLEELEPGEKERFEQHLAGCHACRNELLDLRDVWNALPSMAEEIEPPASLKGRVMESLLPKAVEAAPPPLRVRSPWRWTYVAAAAFLCFAAGGWTVWTLTGTSGKLALKSPAVNNETKAPSQVVDELTLKPFDQNMPNASGKVMVMQQGSTEKMVVELSGLKPTSGEGTYQLWMIKEGKRHNCGTFKVGEQGKGILTYELEPGERRFDALGITLEPDANGEVPRGTKVLGT